jgi:hypothetical protein
MRPSKRYRYSPPWFGDRCYDAALIFLGAGAWGPGWCGAIALFALGIGTVLKSLEGRSAWQCPTCSEDCRVIIHHVGGERMQ